MTRQSVEATQARVGPRRTCAGCRREDAQEEMARLVLDPEGEVVADLGRRLPGRGAWVHPARACVESAATKGLSRCFKTSVRTSPSALFDALRIAADRRIFGLLSSAWRANKTAVGSTPVKESLERGDARLVVVATDARAALSTPGLDDAIATGRAAAWGIKTTIGSAVNRPEVGVLAVLDEGLADALSSMIRIAHLGDKSFEVDRAGGYPFREV